MIILHIFHHHCCNQDQDLDLDLDLDPDQALEDVGEEDTLLLDLVPNPALAPMGEAGIGAIAGAGAEVVGAGAGAEAKAEAEVEVALHLLGGEADRAPRAPIHRGLEAGAEGEGDQNLLIVQDQDHDLLLEEVGGEVEDEMDSISLEARVYKYS